MNILDKIEVVWYENKKKKSSEFEFGFIIKDKTWLDQRMNSLFTISDLLENKLNELKDNNYKWSENAIREEDLTKRQIKLYRKYTI